MTQAAGRRECALPPPKRFFDSVPPGGGRTVRGEQKGRSWHSEPARPLAAALGVSRGGPEPWTRCWSVSWPLWGGREDGLDPSARGVTVDKGASTQSPLPESRPRAGPDIPAAHRRLGRPAHATCWATQPLSRAGLQLSAGAISGQKPERSAERSPKPVLQRGCETGSERAPSR